MAMFFISSYRIVKVEDDQVTFTYKDYSEKNAMKQMTLSALDFIHWFMMHVIPPRYVRIRYFGIMAHRNHRESLNLCRKYHNLKPVQKKKPLEWDKLMLLTTGMDVHKCSLCELWKMELLRFDNSQRSRSPP
jgi:hypothetical protein